MAKYVELEAKYEPDNKVAIHENAVRQLAQRIASHDAGIAELVKNSCDAYSEENFLPKHKVIVILLKNPDEDTPSLVGCLDFVGMTTEKIETRFNQWGDPQASRGVLEGKRKGGHGHGGKAYMVNMFKDYALLLTCYRGHGSRYGFRGGNVTPGYFPDRAQGRRFPVSSKANLLEKNLAPFSTRLKDLPDSAQVVLERGLGFTLVKGVNAKDLLKGRFPVSSLIEDLQGHSQMIEALQEAKIFVIVNGEPIAQAWPLKLLPIEPMDEAKEPKEVPVPDQLLDPSSGEKVSTSDDGRSERGKLVLRTSNKSMMWNYRPRHRIYIHARGEYIGSWDVRDLAGKGFADQIYGDLFLDSLQQYKTSDRGEPANSLLTRAVKEWVRKSIDEYCQVFVKLERLKASQKDRDEWQRISERMNEWKNKFLRNVGIGTGTKKGTGGVITDRTHVPRGEVSTIYVSLSHEYSGIGVAIQPSI